MGRQSGSASFHLSQFGVVDRRGKRLDGRERVSELERGGGSTAAFGVKFKERADAVGMTRCYLEITNDPQHPGYPGDSTAFVKDVFNLSENEKQ